MSAFSRGVQEVDEAMSESSWTALAEGKARDWWSIDMEGEVEKLEVRGPWSVTERDSVDLKRGGPQVTSTEKLQERKRKS